MKPPQPLPQPIADLPPTSRLAGELQALNRRFGQEDVRLGEVTDLLGERAYSLFIFVLVLPFLTPVTLAGLSTPFGAVIACLGLGLMAGRPPWLPAGLRGRRLTPQFFGRILRAAEQIIRLVGRQLRPRLPAMVAGRLARRGVGAAIVLAAGLLALPLPIPLTNTLPALAILCLAAALIAGDGAMVFAGCGFLILSLVYFGLLYLLGAGAYVHLWPSLVAWFNG